MLRDRKRNYLWNYAPSLNCAYIEIPKVCCTTIKAVMQSVERGCDPEQLTVGQIHDRENSPLLNYDQLQESGNNNYRTFAFVRNPYTRIYSAYKDKLVDNLWEKKRRAETLGFSADENIPFIDFLRVISEKPVASLDIHWLPQTVILEDRTLDFIGRFEQFDNDYYIIARALGLPQQAYSRVAHATGTGTSILRTMSMEEVEIINSLYKEDFRKLGYLMLR